MQIQKLKLPNPVCVIPICFEFLHFRIRICFGFRISDFDIPYDHQNHRSTHRPPENTLSLRIEAFEYEILIPSSRRRHLQQQINQQIRLHTIEYLEGNPDAGPPRRRG